MVHYMKEKELNKQKRVVDDILREVDQKKKELNEKIFNLSTLMEIQRVQTSELQATNRKIKEVEEKIADIESGLKILNTTLKKEEEIVSNTHVLVAIVVDDEQNNLLSNGMVDLGRYCLIKLIEVVCDKTKIKCMLGMTQVFYEWSKVPIFHRALERLGFLQIAFLPLTDVTMNVSIIKTTVKSYDENSGNRIFLDKKMLTGIYKLVLVTSESTKSSRGIGVVEHDKLRNLAFADVPDSCGSCVVSSHGIRIGSHSCLFTKLFVKDDAGEVTLAMEMNCEMKTLHTFVNKMQIPYVIAKIPTPVYFWFGVYYKMRAVVQSFCLRRTPTIDPTLSCEQYDWMR